MRLMARFAKHTGPDLEMYVDMIDVTSYTPERDPAWKHTDTDGHEHDATGATFHWVVTETYWIDGDEMTDGEYRCNVCDEVVVPGMHGPFPWRRQIPGMKHYLIDGVEVDEATFKIAYEAAIDAHP
jgi:hypothetical protein